MKRATITERVGGGGLTVQIANDDHTQGLADFNAAWTASQRFVEGVSFGLWPAGVSPMKPRSTYWFDAIDRSNRTDETRLRERICAGLAIRETLRRRGYVVGTMYMRKPFSLDAR